MKPCGWQPRSMIFGRQGTSAVLGVRFKKMTSVLMPIDRIDNEMYNKKRLSRYFAGFFEKGRNAENPLANKSKTSF